MVNLTHLDMDVTMTYVVFSKILVNGKKLETLEMLKIGSLFYERGQALAKGDLPQRLRSASFGLLSPPVFNAFYSFDGFADLMEILSACPSVTDIGIGVGIGIDKYFFPTSFSMLLTDPAKWKQLTSFPFRIRTTAELRHLTTEILPRMSALHTIHLDYYRNDR